MKTAIAFHVQRVAMILVVSSVSITFAAAPKVVKAVPDNGAKDVDPSTTEIRVTFDQPMQPGGFSWVGGGESFPKLNGKAHWADEKTCVLPVKLEAEHDYWLSVNNQSFKNFRSKTGQPATPYPIAFSTGADKNAPKLTVEQNREAIAKLRKAIDDDYAHRDLKKLDWNKLFEKYTPEIQKAQTPSEFARTAAKMLGENQDMHVWLKVGSRTVPSCTREYRPNWNLAVLKKRTGWQEKSDSVILGKVDGFPYILVTQWSNPQSIAPAFEAIGDAVADNAKGIIIDIRNNGGGDDALASQVAGCFINSPKVFAKDRIRKGGEWTEMLERTVEPNRGRPHFKGKVAVLMGQGNLSSSESFLLMMKLVDGCKLIGETTAGSSGNPRPHDLGNGVVAFLSSWEDFQPDGTPIEGVGIKPDIEISGDAKNFQTSDPVLDAAVKYLGG